MSCFSTVPDLYAESLKTKGIITAEEINKLETDYSSVLSQKLLQIEHLKPTVSISLCHKILIHVSNLDWILFIL